MLLFLLIKKDFILIKKYVLIMIGVCLFFPLFILWRLPEYAGIMSLVLTTIFSVFMLLQYVSLKEHQYTKASALLCAAPYPRSLLVIAKYCFCITIFVFCCAVFAIQTLLLPDLGGFRAEASAMLFLVIAAFLGIYLPAQYYFGYEKTKFFFFIIIMASPFFFPQLLKLENSLGFLESALGRPLLLTCTAAFLGAVILIISALVSVRIYAKADLV